MIAVNTQIAINVITRVTITVGVGITITVDATVVVVVVVVIVVDCRRWRWIILAISNIITIIIDIIIFCSLFRRATTFNLTH